MEDGAEQGVQLTPELELTADHFGSEHASAFETAGVKTFGDLIGTAMKGLNPAEPAKFTLDQEIDVATLRPEIKTMLEAKSAKTVGQVLDMYHSAEKVLGQDRIAVPTKGELSKWFSENGTHFSVPEAADKYEVKQVDLPDGMKWDESFEARAREFFHERSLPQEVLDMTSDFIINERINDFKAQGEAAANEVKELTRELRTEWGADFDKNIELANIAANQLELNDDHMALIDKEMKGPGLTMLLAKIGGMLEGASLVTGDGSAVQNMDNSAITEMETLKGDTAFQERLNKKDAPGHAEAVAKWTEVTRKAALAKQKQAGRAA